MTDSIIVITNDIKKELENIKSDSSFSINPSNVDFNILAKTIDKKPNGIEATYKVEFVKKAPGILCEIISVEIDKSVPQKRAYIKVDCNKLDNETDVSLEEISITVFKKLALESIIYGIDEENMNLIAQEIQKRLKPKRPKFKVLVAQGVAPVKGNDAEIKTFFQLNTVGHIDEKGNINFRERNFAVAVEEGTLLAEYIKPTKGIDGFDIFGNILKAEDGQKINIIYKINENDIEKIEDDASIKFIARKSGSLILKNGVFHIENDIQVKKVDIRVGNLKLDNLSDIVVLGDGSILYDTIGASMEVKGKNIIVNGNVGPKAYIEAESVEIKGSVHQEATIKAKTAHIENLSGTLIANEAFIKNASHAHIESENKITIENCFISTVMSPRIEITKNLYNSNTLISLKEIIIYNILGSNNKLIIDPMQIKHIKEQYKNLLQSQKLLLSNILSLQQKCCTLKQKIDLEINHINKVKNHIEQLTQKNLRIPVYLLDVVDKFTEINSRYNMELVKLKVLEDKYNEIEHQLKEITSGYESAQIIVYNGIEPDNEIIFNNDIIHKILTKQNSVKFFVKEFDGIKKIVFTQLD